MGNYMTNYLSVQDWKKFDRNGFTNIVEAAPPKHEGPQKVMVAIDHSKNAEKAFEFYMKNLYRSGTEIVFAHTIEPPYLGGASVLEGFGGWYRSESQKEYEMMMTKKKALTLELEEYYIKKLQDYGQAPYKVRCMEYGGNAGEALIQIAEEEKPMMIVMGSRGLGVIRRTILGSVSHYVIQNVEFPVLVHKTKH